MYIPSDDCILLSVINTALRDRYCSLEQLCEEEDAPYDEICARLNAAGFFYDESVNAFRPKP